MQRILIVDDEPSNLELLKQILQPHYIVIFAGSGEEALAAAAQHHPDLVLLDVVMPGMGGIDVCKRLKADPNTRETPIIFITVKSGLEDESQGFDVGAVDYIQKPVIGPLVLRRVQTHLSLVRVQELERNQRAAIFMLGAASHYHDNDTGVHVWRMAAYAAALAKEVGWLQSSVVRMELAASLHDAGKIGIPDSILKAHRKLTAEEWQIMKQHTQIGFDILRVYDAPVFTLAAETAKNHHEKWDGSGYPEGLSNIDIPQSARIVAIADVFDALTMRRPYKEPWSIEDSIVEIKKNSGSHFEPYLVECFLRILPEIQEIKEIWGNKEIA